MRNIGAAMAGGNGQRRENDFYPTPPEATVALLAALGQFVDHTVHEPACGDGAISRVLSAHGHSVISTDLIDRGFGEGGQDFLASPPRAKSIVTNPPFNLADRFIRHACNAEPHFLALLLKATFWNAARRLPLFDECRPKIVMPLTWRVDFTGGGAPTMDCIWCVWGSRVPSDAEFWPLRKPQLGIFA